MTESERRFTASQRCPHCGVEAPMEIVGSHTRVKREVRERDSSQSIRTATVYELISCPTCEEVSLRSDSESFPKYQHPHDFQAPSLESTKPRSTLISDPFRIVYAATSAARKIDPVAYAAMLGHLATIRECNRFKRF